MKQFDFNLTTTDILEIRISDDHYALGTLCDLYYKNKETKGEFFISDSTLIDFLNTFQDVAYEVQEGQRTIYPSLFDKGIGYYELLDSFLRYNGIKKICPWTDFLNSIGLSCLHKFSWVYMFEEKCYFELSQNFDSFIKDEEVIVKEDMFSNSMILRKEISFEALTNMSTLCSEIRSDLSKIRFLK